MDGKIHVKSNLHLQINETKPCFIYFQRSLQKFFTISNNGTFIDSPTTTVDGPGAGG